MRVMHGEPEQSTPASGVPAVHRAAARPRTGTESRTGDRSRTAPASRPAAAAEVIWRAQAEGRHSLLDRWSVSARGFDALVALSCFALMLFDVPGLAEADNSLTGLTATLVLAAGAATVMVRRQAPWLPFLAGLAYFGWLHELTLVQFGLYSLARYRGRALGIGGTAGYIALAVVLFQVPGWAPHPAASLADFLSAVVPLGVLACGVGISAYRQDLVAQLKAERAEAAALRAVQRERGAIAQDVHDFVGRELTLLNIRSQVLARRARDTAHEADFEDLAEAARRAHLLLNEIIVARADGRAATPGVAGLAELVEQSERAGSPVDLRLCDAARRLSPIRQAAVYRVVQECLTNAIKHAPGERVAVLIAEDGGGRLTVEVRNRLRGAGAPGPAPAAGTDTGTGTGTFSMAERVRSVGGEFTAGPEDGSYVVRATLPTGLG
ncbi:sensor histidine kinase [Streptomyces sp. URMC 123]|uniref:sensor histidine kinase n=1 Tax=Streptomyces sp. URMC 123 TaxID=3423403 RepID=UPI003F1A06F9